jgi:hypothetical protein
MTIKCCTTAPDQTATGRDWIGRRWSRILATLPPARRHHAVPIAVSSLFAASVLITRTVVFLLLFACSSSSDVPLGRVVVVVGVPLHHRQSRRVLRTRIVLPGGGRGSTIAVFGTPKIHPNVHWERIHVWDQMRSATKNIGSTMTPCSTRKHTTATQNAVLLL